MCHSELNPIYKHSSHHSTCAKMEPKVLFEFTKENKFVFHQNVLQDIDFKLNSNIAVLTAIGDINSGKSLILNYCMSYLLSENESHFSRHKKTPLDGFPFSGFSQNDNPAVTILVLNNPIALTNNKESNITLVVLDISMSFGESKSQEIYRAMEMFCLTLGTCVLNITSNNEDKQNISSISSVPLFPKKYPNKTILVRNNTSVHPDQPSLKFHGDFQKELNLNFLTKQEFPGFQGELYYVNDISHLTSFLEKIRSTLLLSETKQIQNRTILFKNCKDAAVLIKDSFEAGKFRTFELMNNLQVMEHKCGDNLTVTEHINPSPGHINPSPEHIKPSPEHIKPSPEHIKPSPEHIKPSPEYRKPSPEHIKPSLKHIKPTPEHIKPNLEHIKPSLKHIKPSLKHIKPSPEHIKPNSEHIKPSLKHIKPSLKHIKPSPEHIKPNSEHIKPSPPIKSVQAPMSLDSFISHQIFLNPGCLVTRKKKTIFIQRLTEFVVKNFPLGKKSTIDTYVAESLQRVKPLLSLNDTFIFKLENELQRKTFVEPNVLASLIQSNRETIQNKFLELKIVDTELKTWFSNLLESSSQMMIVRNNFIFENEAKLDKQLITTLLNKLHSKTFKKFINSSCQLKSIIERGFKEAKRIHSSIPLSNEVLARINDEISSSKFNLGSDFAKEEPQFPTTVESNSKNFGPKKPGLGIYFGDFVQCSIYEEDKFCAISLNEFHFSLTEIPKIYPWIKLENPLSGNLKVQSLVQLKNAFIFAANPQTKVPIEVVYALAIIHCLNSTKAKFKEANFQEIVLAVPYKLNPIHRKTIYDAAILSGIQKVRIISDIASGGLSLFAPNRRLLSGSKGDKTHKILLVQHNRNKIKPFISELRKDFIHILEKTDPKACTGSSLWSWFGGHGHNSTFDSYEGSLHVGFLCNTNEIKKFTGKLIPLQGNPTLDIVNGAAYFSYCLSNGQNIAVEDILPSSIQLLVDKSECKPLFKTGQKFPVEITKLISSDNGCITMSYGSKNKVEYIEKIGVDPKNNNNLKATFSINSNGTLSFELSNKDEGNIEYSNIFSNNLSPIQFQQCQDMLDNYISNL